MEGIMRALYDYNGHVRIWLRNDAKWFVDLHGIALAFIDEGSIYNLKGCHVAWWRGDRIQDHHGNVVFVTHDVQHLETLKPTWHIRPLPPIQRTMPTRPTIGLRPLESRTSGRWADPRAFLDDLLCSVRSAEA
jgi:hypothetical protein